MLFCDLMKTVVYFIAIYFTAMQFLCSAVKMISQKGLEKCLLNHKEAHQESLGTTVVDDAV